MSGRVLTLGLAAAVAALLVFVTAISVLGVTALTGSCPAGPTTEVVSATGAQIPDLDRDQWSNASAIIRTGADLGVPARGQVIAVAVALQESGLRSLDHGDRAGPDSRGLFQQRSAWGSAAERLDAVAAARLFYTGGRHGQAGLLDIPGWAALPLTQTAQAVQHSAHPRAYAAHEAAATAIVTTAGPPGDHAAQGERASCPRPCPVDAHEDGSLAPARICADRTAVLARAENWLTAWNGGPVPYRPSTDPRTWFGGYRRDCSGYASMALGLPGPGLTTAGLAAHSSAISKSALESGDLLINTAPDLAGHVVIFDRWSDTTMSAYLGYEQSADGGTHHRLIPYPYFGDYPLSPFTLDPHG